MTTPPKHPLEALVAVTLSAVAYLAPDSPPPQQRTVMNEALRISGLPTGDEWTVVWGPATHGSNLAFIARGPRRSSGGRDYAYAVRGTDLTPKNLLEDALDTLGLFELPWDSRIPDVKISEGAKVGWEALSRATDGGVTAVGFLKQTVEPGSRLLVTGHSLGGTLAKVMALYFRDELGSRLSIRPITFAAMTVGDRRFAEVFGGYFGGDGRYYSCLDIVPMGFQRDDLVKIRKLYPAEIAPSCEDHLACRGFVDLLVAVAGHRYFHPPGGVRLEARVWDEGGGSLKDFLEEAFSQHQVDHYLWLMGIPLEAIRELSSADAEWSPPTIPCECP